MFAMQTTGDGVSFTFGIANDKINEVTPARKANLTILHLTHSLISTSELKC